MRNLHDIPREIKPLPPIPEWLANWRRQPERGDRRWYDYYTTNTANTAYYYTTNIRVTDGSL